MIPEEEYDFEDDREGSEWCDRCQGLGIADCYCGGDQCYCENYGEMECPQCHGEGWWKPTPAQLEARAETARWWRELHAHLGSDRDGSPEGGDGAAGSVHDGPGPQGHRQDTDNASNSTPQDQAA